MEFKTEKTYWFDCTKEEKESFVTVDKSLQLLSYLLSNGEKVVSSGIKYTKKDIKNFQYLLSGIVSRGFKIEG